MRSLAPQGLKFLRLRKDGEPGAPSQRRLGIRAAGFVDSLVSHEAWVEDDGTVGLRPRPGAQHGAPYWVVRVPREISSGHSDVTGPLFGELILTLMARNRVFDYEVRLALESGGRLESGRLAPSSPQQ